MSQDIQQIPIKKYRLSEHEIEEIRQLALLCEQHDSLRMLTDWITLHERNERMAHDFCVYEDEQLVGYLTMERGADDCELYGMVHPAYRRRGIFQSLVEAAREECWSHGVQRLMFMFDRTSASALAFVQKQGAEYEFSEHEMELVNFIPRYSFDDRLTIHPADIEDIETLVMVQTISFDSPEAAVRRRITSMMTMPPCTYYLATLGGESVECHEPVGALRLEQRANEVGIFAFGILPAYRRRGYGRQILEEVILMVRSQAWARGQQQPRINLYVEIDNEPAIALYRSCGFTVLGTYDYYVAPVSANAGA